MRRDPNIILLGQDIGAYGGTFGVYRGLYDEFGPERVRDGPLCEAATTGFGVGLAISGMTTIVEIEFIDFITLASDALCNQAAKMHYFFGGQVKVPLVVRRQSSTVWEWAPAFSKPRSMADAHTRTARNRSIECDRR